MSFHRDQQRIDDICCLIQKHKLLGDKDIQQLAHDWGDLEDAFVEISYTLSKVRSAFQRFEASPREFWITFIGMLGWYWECKLHMKSAARLINKATSAIERRYPHINPDTKPKFKGFPRRNPRSRKGIDSKRT